MAGSGSVPICFAYGDRLFIRRLIFFFALPEVLEWVVGGRSPTSARHRLLITAVPCERGGSMHGGFEDVDRSIGNGDDQKT